MAAWNDLSLISPLTAEEKATVDQAVPHLRGLLYGRFSGYVRIIGYDDAWEACASALMRAVKTWDASRCGFESYAKFFLRKFLFAAMVERSSAKLPMSIGDFDTFLSGGASPAQIAADREIVAAILRILPQRPREALLLQAAGLTGGEVAKAMGLSLCAVKKYRALTMDRAWRLVPAARGR